MKIKFFANYDSSENLLKRFKNNYLVEDNLLEFTIEDDYDVAVVFNRTFDPIKDSAKVFCIIQEPSWSPINQQNNFLTDSDYLIIHDAELFEKVHKIKLRGKVIESPSFMWFHDRVNYSFFDGTEKIKKKKKLSMIVSSIYMSVGNYRKRIELVDKILKSDLDIDIYGRGLQFEDPRYKGELVNKFTGLLPYEYSICLENCNEKNYLTEKFIDATLCNTIPIYNGAPNVVDIYHVMGFEFLDLNSETIIDDIKHIITNPPLTTPTGTFDKKTYINLNKEIYFKEYNLYNKLKDVLL